MCKKSIDRITHQPTDVTCGLCEKIYNCSLPAAIQRRQATARLNSETINNLSGRQIRQKINTDDGSLRLRQ